ncbi:hypothetical protein B0H16DRAFT_1718657 [Mycena metata]|uniref:Uncharacterized protein n=1 Tax=Mycena metata TaxID=1033252 RepID=A0AAD7JFM4_9AGAR|nr:hypothetical protein B0H16DRAFT_1718657 [Mycena metata]
MLELYLIPYSWWCKVYLKHPKGDFWDKLDLKLQDIREKAWGDSKKVVRAFRSVLEADQAKHGHKTYKDSDMEDQADEFQQTVDNIIDIGAMDAATSTQDQPGGVIDTLFIFYDVRSRKMDSYKIKADGTSSGSQTGSQLAVSLKWSHDVAIGSSA